MKQLAPVDSLTIDVLVDNHSDALSSVAPGITSEWQRARNAGHAELSGDGHCCANHGLSLVVTARRGATTRRVLFDAGPAAASIDYNSDRLDLDLPQTDAVVLSHGHWDHAGGLPAALRQIRGTSDKRVPVYCHPEMWHQRALPLPDGSLFPIKPIPTREELTEAGGDVVVTTEEQLILDDMFYVSDEIARRTDYELGFPGHMRRLGDDQPWEPDPQLLDERYLAVDVAGLGPVVFSACSHAGIVNVQRDAADRFGQPIYALCGGFHLSGGNEKIIGATVDDLANADVAVLLPGHCTGWRAVAALDAAMPDGRVTPLAVGMRIELPSST